VVFVTRTSLCRKSLDPSGGENVHTAGVRAAGSGERAGAPVADGEVEDDREVGVVQGLSGVRDGVGFDAMMQRGQVGALLEAGLDDQVGAGGVADESGFGGVHAWVGADFVGDGVDQRRGEQGGAPGGAVPGESDVIGAVGGEQQRGQPTQRKQRHEEAGGGDGRP